MLIAIISLLLASSVVEPGQIASSTNTHQCLQAKAIALSIVKEFMLSQGRDQTAKVILSKANPHLSDYIRADAAGPRGTFWQAWLAAPEGAKPSQDLINSWNAMPSASAFDCIADERLAGIPVVPQEIADKQNKKNVQADAEALSSGAMLSTKGRIYSLQIGMPIVDRDEKYALVPYTSNCGVVCGEGGVFLMMNSKRGWSQIAYRRAVNF